MAEQAILTVSLRDYKRQIDDLRASLLNLESTSEEYKAIAEQIKTQQGKLNEVMGIGKKEVDAVAGSYNDLSKRLSDMKKEWKNMKIGTEEWTALGEQINEVNNQLKEADSSVGVFSRNVGNYENAFKSAFSAIIPQLSQLSPGLSQITSLMSKLIPVIKSVTATATAGIHGIKAALVSTGIGALIVAGGVALSYFTTRTKEASEAIKSQTGLFKEENEALQKLQKTYEAYNSYMAANGANAFDVMINKIEYLNKIMDKQMDLLLAVKSGQKVDEELAESFSKNFKEWRDTYDEMYESALKFYGSEKNAIAVTEENLSELDRKVKDMGNNYDSAILAMQMYLKRLQENLNSASGWAKEEIESKIEQVNQLITGLEEQKQESIDRLKIEEGRKIWKQEEQQISALTTSVVNSFKTRKQVLEDSYKKEKKLMEKHHKDTTALTKKYLKDIAAAEEDVISTISSSLSSLSKLNSGFTKDSLSMVLDVAETKLKQFSDIVNNGSLFPPNAPLSKTIEIINSGMSQMAFEMGLIKTNTVEDFAIAWQVAAANVRAAAQNLNTYYEDYQKLLAQIERDKSTVATFPEKPTSNALNPRREAEIILIKDRIEETEQILKPYWDLIIRWSSETDETIKKQLESEVDAKQDWAFKIINVQTDLNKRIAALYEEQYEQERAAFDRRAEDANRDGDLWGIWSQKSFNESFEKRIEAELFALDIIDKMEFESASAREEFEREHQQALLDIQKEYNQAKIQNYQDLATGIGSIFGSIADMYAEDINAQVDSGKKSRKQAERDYKRVQNIKIATATIDTIQGALAAFMGYQELGQPWGGILGGIQAAAVTAAGIAQIQKIKNTNPYSDSSSLDSSSYAGATPQMREYSPEYFSNITGANDTKALANALAETPIKCYITESEVTSAQELQEERDKEATF